MRSSCFLNNKAKCMLLLSPLTYIINTSFLIFNIFQLNNDIEESMQKYKRKNQCSTCNWCALILSGFFLTFMEVTFFNLIFSGMRVMIMIMMMMWQVYPHNLGVQEILDPRHHPLQGRHFRWIPERIVCSMLDGKTQVNRATLCFNDPLHV